MTGSMTQRVEFPGSQGDMLAARLDLPAGDTPRAYAIFAHCFTCSKDILAATRVSRELALRGVAVLRFDFTGLGHSDGEFANTNFSSNVELSQPRDALLFVLHAPVRRQVERATSKKPQSGKRST